MLKCLKKIDKAKTGIFAAGVLFGTAGIKVLSSKDAKKLYTNCTAAVLRAKECVMKTATTIQENAEDIYAEAQQINEDRAAQAAKEYDGEAEAAISEINPDYKPWFSSFFEPASGEIESLLFASQAALGAGIVGYYIGATRTKHKMKEEK